MPITAFSREARRELDLEQWLKINGYEPAASRAQSLPAEIRARAAADIECSCCQVLGASLVTGAVNKASGRAVGQGHFRFRNGAGASAHHPMCDYFDERKTTGGEYLHDFRSDKSALTKLIRNLVCRGIENGLFSQLDMRQMRIWFLRKKEANSAVVIVTPELLQWCLDLHTARMRARPGMLPFQPVHATLPAFDWRNAANFEWIRRNEHLVRDGERWLVLWGAPAEVATRLVSQLSGRIALDPLALRQEYEATLSLAAFASHHLSVRADTKPLTFAGAYPPTWGPTANPLLALCALLLFRCEWNLEAAVSLFAILIGLPPEFSELEGNLIGLNPFYQFEAWQVIDSARNIGLRRTDARPVAVQVDELMEVMKQQYADWTQGQAG